MPVRVLIIEDSDLMLRFLACSLRPKFECVLASSGRKAVALFAEALELGQPFDLVLTDYHLPDVSGLDVARSIREMEQAPAGAAACGIMVLSSDATLEETRPQGREYGISGWLTKPVLPDELLRRTRELLEERAAGRPG